MELIGTEDDTCFISYFESRCMCQIIYRVILNGVNVFVHQSVGLNKFLCLRLYLSDEAGEKRVFLQWNGIG